MHCEIQVGPRYVKEGSENIARAGITGEMCVDDTHPKYYEAVSRGNVYHASMQAGASLGTALTATAVTLTLYNPQASGKNLVLISASVGITTVPSGGGTAVYALTANVNPYAAAPTGTTAATVRNSLLGGTNGVGLAYTAATLPAAPIIVKILNGGIYWATAAGAAAPMCFTEYLDGAIILAPNSAVTIQGIGVATSGVVSMTWEEVPV
jgi:hypothetical protein